MQGKIKELEKKVRHLEKENRALKKYDRSHELPDQDEEIQLDSEDTFPVLEKRIPCDGPEGCGKGYFKEMELMGKIYGSCDVCGRHKRLK